MKNYPEKRSLTILGLIFLLLVLGIAGAGYLSYRNFEEQFRVQVAGQLTAIANLKEAELFNWRNERLAAEAEMLRRNSDFALHTQHYFKNPGDTLAQKQIQTWLQSFRAHREYDRVSLLDLAGQVRVTDSGEVVPASAALIEHIPAVLQSKQVAMIDFYRDEANQTIHLAILIPIMANRSDQEVIGLVALRINPHVYLYPYLHQWPMPSTSAETLLIRREGKDVLFLNELRFKPDAALTLRFPLEQTERPAVKAALGQTGIVEGLGYYDESVLTDVRAIPGTPWFLMTEIGTAEAYAPLRERAWTTVIFFGTLILAIVAGLALVWRQQNIRHYRQVEEVLSKKNHELQELVGQLEQSQNMLQLVIESIPIRVFWKDKELRYLGCNSMFAHDAGLSQPQQLVGKDDFAMGWKEQADLYRADDRLVMTSGHPKFNIVEPQTTPAGTTIWLNTSKVPLQNPDGEITSILGIYEDITERKQAEEALRQSEERHRIIAQLATDDVYVGWLFPDGRIESEWMTGALERITGYSTEEIKAWPNNLASIVVEQDLDKLSELRPRLLRHESVAVEYRIRCKNGDVRWLSNQIKPMPDKTREPAVRLLSAVQDITERKQTEEALRQSEELYRTLVEALDVTLSRWLPDTTLVFANEKYRRVFGFEHRIAGQKWLDFFPEAIREETAAFYRDLARRPRAISYERSVTTSDGSLRHYQWIDTPILDAKGRAAVFQSVGFDLTERKHTEQLVHAQRDLARIIGTVTSAEAAWPLCLEIMLWVSGMDSGGIYLFDGAGSALELVYQQGLGADFVQAVSRYPINTPSAQMVLAGVPLYFSAADLNQIHHQTEGLYALATIPIQYQGEVLGCFNIASHSLAEVPDFARHALETIAPEIGNIIMYLRTASLLRESEEKYRSLVDSQDAVIATVDADGVYHYMNPIGAVPLAGSVEAVVGRNLRDFFPSPSAEWQLSGIRQVIATGQGLVSEYKTMLIDQPIWWRVSIQPVRDAAGQVALAMVNSVDITERKRLETALRQSEERYRIISGAVTDYAFSTQVNENGEFVMDWVAGAFEEITGYTFEEFVARGGWQASLHPDDLYIDNHIREELVSNRSAVGEMRIFSKTGQIVHLRLYARPVWAERENKLKAIYGAVQNITERKQAEQALRESEERLRQITSSLREVIWLRDAQTRQVLYVNPAFEELTGWTCENFYENRDILADAIYPDDRERMIKALEQRSESIPFYQEHRLIHRDGSIRWVSSRSFPVRDTAGMVYRWVTNMEDITERKKAEDALRAEQQRFTQVAATVPGVITTFLLRPDGTLCIPYASPAFENVYGLTLADVAENINALTAKVPPEQVARLVEAVSESARTLQSWRCEYPYRHPLKGDIWLEGNSMPVREADGSTVWHGITTDITERKQAEAALRKSESLLAEAQRVGRTGHLEWTAPDRNLICSDELYAILELPKASGPISKQTIAAMMDPEDRERLHGLDVETFVNRADTDYEYRINLPDGRVRWLHQQGKMSYDEAGKPVRMMGIIQDITERKQAEAELHRTEKRYRALIEHAPDGIVLVSGDGKLKYISPSTERLFGYLSDEDLNLDPAELTHPDDRARVIAALVDLMQDPSQRSTLEYRFLHKNGDWRWVQSTFSNLLAVPNVEAIVINFKDITERKQAEEAQRESEERFRTLYETMLQGIVYQDAEGRIIGANPAAERILGLTLDQMQGFSSIDPRWRAIHEDGSDFPGDTHPAMVALRTGEPVYNVIMGVFHPHIEQYVWISINAAPQFKPGQAKPYQVYALFEDITVRKLNQDLVLARLRLIEFASTHTVKELLQATLDESGLLVSSPIGFYHFVDPDQNTLTLQAWSTRTRNEFCTAAGEDSHYPVDLAGVWSDCLRQRRPIIHNDYATLENRKGLPAGHAEVVREAVVPIMRGDQVVAILGIGNKPTHYTPDDLEIINTFADMSWDIVERKRAEENLRESRLRVELALKGANAGMWDWYVQTGQTIFNERWAEIIGYSLAELEPVSIQTWIDVCHPDDLKLSDVLLQRHFARETEFYECEARMKHRNGSWVWVIDRGKVVEWDASGKPVRMTGTHLDITESKQAEQDLLELNRTLEERVRQRTAEVQDLYDNAPTGYHSLDKNGVFLMMNQTELNWLGYTREEVVGSKSVSDLVAPQSQEIFATTFPLLKNQGWVKDVEFDLIRKDGSILPVLLHATAVYDEQGNFVMSRSTVSDNTERKKAETALRESEEQNRLLFEESPDAVVLFDETGQVVQANHAFEQLTGYAREQLTGYTLDELGLLSSEQTARLAGAIMQSFRQNSHFQAVELKLQRSNQESRDVGARIFGVQIRGRQHYLTTMRDITTEKQAEKTLRLANAELARAARAKDEFLANMSHELRTPLNAILGFSEALLEQIRGPLNERQQASVRNIEASGRHLLALISDILDLSKVEAGRLELLLEVVPVADVCQASLLFVKETALKKDLQLAFHLNNQLAKVQADPKRLKQMLVNLLSNAVKFTPERGQVSLVVTADAEAGVIRFAVQDNGIGITPEGLARLFQPFMQLDSSLSRQYEGTGLGLALVRRLAELHGGSVTVESDGVPGRGSRFTIALPYHPSPADTGPAASETEHTAVRRPLHSALVVEDTKSAAEQLARYLQEANVHVVVHPQGAGALDQAVHLQPDVIFLDLLMPDQSGWDVLTQLKADPRTRHIPVVIVSVMDEPVKGLTAGAAVYLVKPITREIIQRALNAAAGAETVREALVIVPEVEPAGARILLAEDNELNIEAFEDYLQGQGYQVVVARNGREAMTQATETRPDLILMDIQMPELDGLEAIRQLRGRADFATTPIIALTALAMPGDRERCLSAGANEYLTKPIRLKGLVEIIEKLLQQ